MDEPQLLQIEVVSESSRAWVTVEGELDLVGAPQLDAALARAYGAGVSELVLDLRGVTFIDSSGIRCVIDAHHQSRSRGFDLHIHPGLEAAIVFDLAGLTGRLPLVA
jgi:anti-anti-sigma factor